MFALFYNKAILTLSKDWSKVEAFMDAFDYKFRDGYRIIKLCPACLMTMSAEIDSHFCDPDPDHRKLIVVN